MKFTKKHVVTFFVVLFAVTLFLSPVSYADTNQDISVLINGSKIEFDVPPTVLNGRTLVPMRKIFEELGATVRWDQNTKTVTAWRGERTFSLQIGGMEYVLDNQKYSLDVPATVINQRTLIPARLVAEAFDCEVTWDQSAHSVIIVGNIPNLTTDIENGNGADAEGSPTVSGNARRKRIVIGEDSKNTMEATIDGSKVLIKGALAYDEFSHVKVELYHGSNFDNLVSYGEFLNNRYEEYATEENWWYSYGNAALGEDRTFDFELNLPDSPVQKIYIFGIYRPKEGGTDRYPDDGDLTKDYVSIDNDVLYIVKRGEHYYFISSKEYRFNQAVLKNLGEPNQYLSTAYMDDSVKSKLQALSDGIVKGAKTDREKLLKIHDWMTKNMFYNYDYDNIKDIGINYNAPLDIVDKRTSQCYGFSILFTDLARLQGIPTTKVIGYIRHDTYSDVFPKGEENLHSWNISYVDGKWIHIDVTWDIMNTLENSQIYRKMPSHSYFDINLEAFSFDHLFDYFRETHEWY